MDDTQPHLLRRRPNDPEEYWGMAQWYRLCHTGLTQADVIQLLALTDEFPAGVLQANQEYCEPPTDHGSSLSPSVHTLVACKANHQEEAYHYFFRSLYHRPL